MNVVVVGICVCSIRVLVKKFSVCLNLLWL